MIVEFYNALADAMRADTGVGSLVALTGDTAAVRRLLKHDPDRVAVYPVVVFRELDTTPFIEESHADTKLTTVEFTVLTATSVLTTQLADRLDTLLQNKGSAQHLEYWDIGNASIRNCSTIWRHRTGLEYDDDEDKHRVQMIVDFIWRLI